MSVELGLGMDLPWHPSCGILTPSLKSFLRRYSTEFEYFFFSFQPNDFDLLTNPHRIQDYLKGYDELVELLPHFKDKLALHHTMLNLGTLEEYPREKIVEFTNVLIERYKLKWVNEDLGIWSLKGKNLPYPMPPYLTDAGLKASIANIDYYQKHLKAPLFVEFPGFSEGGNFIIGKMDAFEFYKTVITETNAHAVLDTGHILSYQWMKNKRSHNLLEGLDNALPFDQCSEIHLSGCSIVQDRFKDFHHGILLDEQLVLLDYLLRKCPNLKSVTFEDPKFTSEGVMIPKALPNFEKLKTMVARWK